MIKNIFSFKNIAIAVLLVVIFIMCYWYSNVKDTLHDVIAARHIDSMSHKTILNAKGMEIAQGQAIILYQQQQIQEYGDTVFNLTKKQARKDRDYIALLRAKQQLELQFSAEYIMDDSEDTAINQEPDIRLAKPRRDSIAVPKRFAYQDGNMNMYGTVRKDRVDIDSGHVDNTISFRLLEKKRGLFSRGVNVDAINSNKIIHFDGVQALYVEYRPTMWNKYLKPALAFCAGAVALRLLSK